MLRGLQDTATTLWVTLVAVLTNLVLALVVGARRRLGDHRIRLGDRRSRDRRSRPLPRDPRAAGRQHGASLRPTQAGVLVAARGAVPLFLRTVALRAVFVLAVAVAARLGDAELAAYYVTFTVWYLLALAMDALAIAGQALMGRHLGAGQALVARAVTWQMTRWGIGLGVLLLVARAGRAPVAADLVQRRRRRSRR